MTIRNSNDLVNLFSCADQEDFKRYLYKYTDCGMSISFQNPSYVDLLGYVESDYDWTGPHQIMLYPFESQEFNDTVQWLDQMACKAWDIIHDTGMTESEKQKMMDFYFM